MATTTAPTLPALDVSKSDDPRVVEEAATEDYSLHVVPEPPIERVGESHRSVHGPGHDDRCC